MEKTVGKIIALAISLIHLSCAGGLSLRIADRMGTPLKEITAGESFNIEIVSSGQMRDFQLEELNAAIVLTGERTQSTQFVNGVVTTKYAFGARADKIGEFTIGPAHAEISGNKETSDRVMIKVVAEKENTKKNVNEVLFRLNASKKKIMVGEQVAGSIRFYSCNSEITPDQFIQSDLSAFALSPMTEPSYGKETIDGVEYSYLEISWQMSAKKPGSITIPAWCAHYSMPMLQDAFGPFRFMQSLQRQQKRIYSNALTIDVAPLPAYDGTVHAVGSFDDFSIHATSKVAKAGDANVIRLDIVGDGTFEGYEALQLLGIPEGLKSYESKQYVSELANGAHQTSYEFIVQGLKPGEWEIPAQEFTYFDVNRKEYKTHKTQPLTIAVLAQPELNTGIVTPPAEDVEQKAKPENIDPKGLRMSASGSSNPQTFKELSLTWFVLLLVLPLGIVGVQKGRHAYDVYQANHEPLARKKNAHARAYKAVADVEKRKAYHELYPIFVELFASRTESSIPECSDDAIITVLRERGMSEDEVAAWQRFFTDIMRLAYAGAGQQSKVTNDIIKRSYEWLNRLKGVL
jgi:hypothetical protein